MAEHDITPPPSPSPDIAVGRDAGASVRSPPWAGRALTPMLRQYVEAKAVEPDALLMFRMGDFYELFFDDAKVAAEALDLTLTARDKGPNPVPMAGVPHHAVEGYIARLVALGHSVAICDQMEDPKAVKGIVKRAVTRLVTPATVSDLTALDPGQSPWLASVIAVDATRQDAGHLAPQAAVALLDLLTGELLLTSVATDEAFDELAALGAREVLADEPMRQALWPQAQHSRNRLPVRPLPPTAKNNEGPPVRPSDAGALRAAPTHGQAALARAIAAVLAYGAHTQRRAVPHVGGAKWFHRSLRLGMDEATRQNLELFVTHREQSHKGALLGHLDRTCTPMGARLLRRWTMFPLRRLDAINRRADAVAALCADRAARQRLRLALQAVRDVARLSGRVALGRATPRDVQALAGGLVALRDVQAAALTIAQAQAPQSVLLTRWRTLSFPHALGAKLRDALLDELPTQSDQGGLFRRGIDAQLDTCLELTEGADAWLLRYEQSERKKCGIATLKVRYNRVFGYFLELSRAQAKSAPAHFVRKQTTVNAERFATRELDEFSVRAGEASERRCSRERELFEAAMSEIRDVLFDVQRIADEVARLDVLQSLAEVADRHRYVRPMLHERRTLSLQQARHPVLETLLPLGERFVANDLSLQADGQGLVILTGPNMAGKSTIMRQAALCVLLAQMGGFVPCQTADIGLCDQLFVRVGASDNLGRGQSTFMVEMTETASILRHATAQSLVLLDEIGRGTSTFDGLSIAWAVAEYLDDVVACRALFATHYHELCRLADARPRIVNMQVAVHEADGRIAFLRELRAGAAGKSYGIEVARLAAVPAPVLARAEQILYALEGEPRGAPESDAALSAVRRLKTRQLNLFGAANDLAQAPPAERAPRGPAKAQPDPMRARLAQLDPERMTPLQALQAIFELKRQA